MNSEKSRWTMAFGSCQGESIGPGRFLPGAPHARLVPRSGASV